MTKKTKTEPKTESSLVFLIVDDDSNTRQTVRDYLAHFGYTNILEAEDGGKAISVIKTTKVDFIISDWEMPGLTGLDLLKLLKESDTLKHIPFVMITSPVSKERDKIERAAAANVDSYIVKPFRSKVLKDKIDQLLLQRNLSQKGALVVDDDDDVRSTVVDYLKDLGYGPVYEARDGEEGFQKVQQHASEIAFVISDWEMPKLAGIELLRRVRSEPSLSYMPFIMVTSQTSIERMKLKKALEADVDNYLLKPFRGEELKERIDFAVTKAKTRLEVDRQLDLAKAYAEEEKYTQAEKAYQKVFSIDPSSVRACLGLAAIQVHLMPDKGHEKAMAYIRRAISMDPKSGEAHVALALTYENAMSLEKAIACLHDAAKNCDNDENIFYHLGRILLRRGKKVEANEALQRALKIRPDFTEAIDLLTTSLANTGKANG